MDTEPLVMSESGGLSYSAYRDLYEGALNPDPDLYAFDYGIPLDGGGSPLPGGGIFPTDFYEYFIGDFTPSYDVNNYFPGEFEDTTQGWSRYFISMSAVMTM